MCNLYDIGPAPEKSANWTDGIEEATRQFDKTLAIRKTDPGLVVRPGENGYEPIPMRWGFLRDFNPSVNNARSEKIGSGMWNRAWRENRRCLIPVAAFYEWTGPKGQKVCYAFRSRSGSWLGVAGLWERSRRVESCGGFCYTMLTCAAEGEIAEIHHRMPLILDARKIAPFLAGDDDDTLLSPCRDELEFFPCQSPLRMKTPSPPVPL